MSMYNLWKYPKDLKQKNVYIMEKCIDINHTVEKWLGILPYSTKIIGLIPFQVLIFTPTLQKHAVSGYFF